MKPPRSTALRAKDTKHILDTTPHTPDPELSRRTLSEAYNLAGGSLLLVFDDGKGSVYESKDELLAALDQLEEKARRDL